MIDYEQAFSLLLKAQPLKTQTLLARDACGQVLAERVVTCVCTPPFSNAAMDGFAVCAADLDGASAASPVTLPVMGRSVAGDAPSCGDGGAWEIMTGAPMPQGYNAVVKVEDVTVDNDRAHFSDPVAPGRNLRLAGEDFEIGDEVAVPGTLLTPHHVMALTSIGCAKVAVHRQPTITVFSTGRELTHNGDNSRPLPPGHIHDCNGPYLMSALQAMGYVPRHGGTVGDNPEQFAAELQQASAQTDIIVSTGAVSAGKHDFIPDCLRRLGANIMFHKVKIRPAKPVLYACLPNGTHYFGLPGNPISAAVGLRFFALPLIRHLQGMAPEAPIAARLDTLSPKKLAWRFFLKAHLGTTVDGGIRLTILDGQESFKIHPLLVANCWAVLTENKTGDEVGTMVDVYPSLPDHWSLGPCPPC